MQWYLTVLKRYAEFTGRAQRAEYWYFVLFNTIISLVLSLIDNSMGSVGADGSYGLLSGLYALAVLVPSIAVSIRRLHDTGRSGWWLLIALIPILGFLVLLYFMVQDSEADTNAFGPNPKQASLQV